MGLVLAWTIDPDYSTPSDHELITFELEKIDHTQGGLGPSNEVTGWAIKNATKSKEKAARRQWKELTRDRQNIKSVSIQMELDEGAG